MGAAAAGAAVEQDVRPHRQQPAGSAGAEHERRGLRAVGAVVSTEQLLERAWDENIDPFTNVVRVTVMNLRRKLGPPAVVETVPGIGYRIR